MAVDKRARQLHFKDKAREVSKNEKARRSLGSMIRFLTEPPSSRSLRACIRLLESPLIVKNRKGLEQLLVLATKEKYDLSCAVVQGLEDHSGMTLRSLLVKFLCDSPEDLDQLTSSSYPDANFRDELREYLEGSDELGDSNYLFEFLCSEESKPETSVEPLLCATYDSEEEDEDDDRPWGIHRGSLHLEALQIFSVFLEEGIGGLDILPKVDFDSFFWRSIAATIVHNIEINFSAEISGYSLRCLRYLHMMDPDAIESLILRSLLPYITFLNQGGNQNDRAMTIEESHMLLQSLSANDECMA